MPTTHGSSTLTEGRELVFPKGTNVLGSSLARRGILWLRSGHVRLSHNDNAIIDHLEPGAIFGEKAMLDPPRPRDTATCLSPVTVIVFRKTEFFRTLQQERGFAKEVFRSLAQRLTYCEQRISSFVTEPAEIRL